MPLRSYSLFLGLFLFLAIRGFGQSVNVSLTISPPYPVYLEDLLEFRSQTLVTLTNTSATTVQVKLLTSIEEAGGEISLEVKNSYLPASPITLMPFQTLSLNGAQLRNLNQGINENDVQYQGFDREQLIQSGALPEGVYTICLRAMTYEVNGTALSNEFQGCTNLFITHYDPPILLQPQNEAAVNPQQPQFLIFNWTPSGLPLYTRYRLELIDMTMNNIPNPNDAFEYPGIGVYFQRDNILSPNLVYDAGLPPLIDGRTYAVRVTAYDPSQTIQYRNQGHSPVSVFHYEAEDGGLDNNVPDDDEEIVIVNPQPDPNQNYQAPCSPVNCSPGLPNGPAVSGGFGVGSTLSLGYFNMELTEVAWGGNNITGKGKIEVPMFNTWVNVDFDNLQVNAQGQVINGQAFAITDPGATITEAMRNTSGQLAGITASQVEQVKNYVEQGQRYTELLNPDGAANLPFALKTDVQDLTQLLNITGMSFGPDGALLNAFLPIEIPEAINEILAFGSKGICFHPTGLSAEGLQELTMLGTEVALPFGPNIDLVVKPGQGEQTTRVKWDCQGYESLQVAGAFVFNGNMLTPVEGNDPVAADFFFLASVWGDFIGELSMPAFYVKGLKGLEVSEGQVMVDYSDIRAIDGIQYPTGYQGNQSEIWKGFYFPQLALQLPTYLRKKNNDRITINAEDLLIDKLGVSGEISAAPLLALNQGNLGGWQFSIDQFQLTLVNNSLQESIFDGEVRLPISDAGIGYSCSLSQTDQDVGMEFTINPLDDISVDMWAANLTLLPGSTLSVTVEGQEVLTAADMSGSLTLAGGLPDQEGMTLDFPDMAFEHLVVRNKAPYLSCELFSLASPQKSLNGFEVSINPENEGEGVALVIGDSKASLQLGFSVKLHNATKSIEGLTQLSISGSLVEEGNVQSWQYDGSQLEKIVVDADLGFMDMYGEVNFYNGSDPTFGRGFRGDFSATVQPSVSIETFTVQFGKVDGYRYWFVDAKAIIQPGIVVAPGFAIYGFGGGAYYHMKATGFPSAENMKGKPGTATAAGLNEVGATSSGVTYLPDENTLFGLKASVVIGISPDPTPFNADIEFSMQINSNGGLDFIRLTGDGYFMTDIMERDDPKVLATVDMMYTHPDKTFEGTFGVDFMYGSEENPVLVGEGSIYTKFAPGVWKILAGTPSDRMNMKIFSAYEVGTYIMMGNQIPPPPDLPPGFQNKEGLENFSLVRNLSGDKVYEGLAFGQQINFAANDLKFLIFYADMDLTVGYDVALLKNAISCEGMNEVGFNDYYAIGKAYAGFDFTCGIDIDTWFLETKIEVFSAYLYAAVEVGLPNPTWVKGAATGAYSVLNGKLEGNFNFKFEAGQICTPSSGGAFEGLEIIADMAPKGSGEDVFVTPQVAFNLPIGKNILLQEDPEDPNSTHHEFRFSLDNVKLERVAKWQNDQWVNLNQAETVAGNFFLKQTQLAQFRPDEALKGYSKYRLTAKVWGEHRKFSIAETPWKTITVAENDPATAYEIKTQEFTTGARPQVLTNSNILDTYPRRHQRYFYKDDGANGVIRFKSWPSYLFATQPSDPENYQYRFVVRFHQIKNGATVIGEVPLQLDPSKKQVTFEMPSLEHETIYMVQLLALLEKKPGAWLANNESALTTETQTTDFGQGNTANVQYTRINSSSIGENEHELYALYFRTSKYSHILTKWNNYTNQATQVTAGNGSLKRRITATYTGDEAWDFYDLNPSANAYGAVPPLLGICLTAINMGNEINNNGHGVRWPIHHYYKTPLQELMATNLGSSITASPYTRNVPGAGEYPLNSSWLHGKPISNGMDLYAIGIRYTGNGQDNKLTNNEIVSAYNQGGGGVNIQNLQVNNGGGGGNLLNMNTLQLAIPVVHKMNILYDHAHHSFYAKEQLKQMITQGGLTPNWGDAGQYTPWKFFVDHGFNQQFIPKVGQEKLYYRIIRSLPAGVQHKSGLQSKETYITY
ncbi:MAG: hypothetical protein ACRBG0_18305 [Lewinella sp.]|uniref:hypothetical protein n=1 Tax=Lewinella sp. TaxID=2004506 RepID=UPI003D6BE025